LEVKLKYEQQGGDSLVIFCYLSRYNKKSQKSEKIGGMYFTYDKPIDEYTTFIFPIYYVAEGEPDTINIGFFSSNQYPHDGSTLLVDSLVLHYGEFLLPPQADFPEEITDSSFVAKWSGADYTKGYILQVASDEDFNNILPGYDNVNVGDTNQYLIKIPDTTVKEIYYRVKADYDSVVSDYSNVINFAVPYPPKNLRAVSITNNSFMLKWDSLQLCDYYILLVAENEAFSDFLPDFRYHITYEDTVWVYNLEAEHSYYCAVKGYYPVAGKTYIRDTIEVTTLPKPEEYDLKILTLSNSIVFMTDTTFLNSNLTIYHSTGQMFFYGTLKSTSTEITIPATDLYIIQIQKPNGDIIRKKLVVVIDE
jgi:hypothetical protein